MGHRPQEVRGVDRDVQGVRGCQLDPSITLTAGCSTHGAPELVSTVRKVCFDLRIALTEDRPRPEQRTVLVGDGVLPPSSENPEAVHAACHRDAVRGRPPCSASIPRRL